MLLAGISRDAMTIGRLVKLLVAPLVDAKPLHEQWDPVYDGCVKAMETTMRARGRRRLMLCACSKVVSVALLAHLCALGAQAAQVARARRC